MVRSPTGKSYLGAVIFLCALKALEQKERILETQKCQTGDLRQAGEKREVFVYLQKGREEDLIINGESVAKDVNIKHRGRHEIHLDMFKPKYFKMIKDLI